MVLTFLEPEPEADAGPQIVVIIWSLHCLALCKAVETSDGHHMCGLSFRCRVRMQSISRASLNKGVLIYLCCDALLCVFTTAYLHTQKSFCAKNKLSVTLAGVIPATGGGPPRRPTDRPRGRIQVLWKVQGTGAIFMDSPLVLFPVVCRDPNSLVIFRTWWKYFGGWGGSFRQIHLI